MDDDHAFLFPAGLRGLGVPADQRQLSHAHVYMAAVFYVEALCDWQRELYPKPVLPGTFGSAPVSGLQYRPHGGLPDLLTVPVPFFPAYRGGSAENARSENVAALLENPAVFYPFRADTVYRT